MKTIILSNIAKILKNLSKTETVAKFGDSSQVRNYWERKKRQIRVFFAFGIIVFNIFGFELSTPHYSLTTEFASAIINNISFISNHIYSPTPDNKAYQTKTQPDRTGKSINDEPIEAFKKVEFGNTIKTCAYSIFIIIFLFAFINADPFSKLHLILDFIEEEKIKRWKKNLPNIKDMIIYAKMAPSNKLYFTCKECRHSGYCENNLRQNKCKRNEIWTKIFIDLEKEFVFANLRLVNQCRKWHFMKYSILYSSLLLICVYIGVRISEYLLPDVSVNYNWQLLSFIILSFISYFILHKIDPSLKQLKDHLDIFYSSPQFKLHFKEKTCQREEPNTLYDPRDPEKSEIENIKEIFEVEIKKLRMTIEFFTHINQHRIDNLIEKATSRNFRETGIRDILSYIVHMFSLIYNHDEISFSASLLVPEGEMLKTWITERFNGNNFTGNNLFSDVQRKDVFALNGNSVASKSWRHNRALASNNEIAYLYNNQKDYLRSIIAIPIECSEKLYRWLNESEYIIDKIIGILCVTSSNGSIFTRKRCEMNITMLNPFVSLINYQYSIRVIEKIRKRP